MLRTAGENYEGKRCLVSGSGNVAQYAIEKLLELGAIVLTVSDSAGFIHDPAGITSDKLAFLMDLKNVRRGRVAEYAEKFPGSTFTPTDAAADSNPLWNIPADMAFPCATQNEICKVDAEHMAKNGVKYVIEGANMPSDLAAIKIYTANAICFAPGKASNAGGVAVSGLEMSQNSARLAWTKEEVADRLDTIMSSIYKNCWDTAKELGCEGDLVVGANCAGFEKVANAMLAQGAV
mmetsp:Transcript_24908/g.62280  ORF Transcript_24908/g.62280 Transcript_24908/m.62280 type:complete len:235 (-) Transcript_24908:312-1016(-)